MTRGKLRLIAAGTVAAAAAAALVATVSMRTDRQEILPSHGILGVTDAQLSPDFWIERLEDPDRVVFARSSIEARNAALLKLDDSMFELRGLPADLSRERVAGWIEDLAASPSGPLYDASGAAVPAAAIERIVGNRNMAAIPQRQPTRFGMVVRRSALRTFPTMRRVFRSPDDTDIDRFQESALFPGTPVVIAHESRDGGWWFVVSPRYAAWIEKRYVAEGRRDEILAWQGQSPYRIVTGATVETVFNPERPALSQLRLEMGLRLPLAGDWPAGTPVNGQHPYSAYVLELPLRGDDGSLSFAPALLPKNAATEDDYLPLTHRNIIRQGFRFLGERYGWGHSYNARDCSGFVSEVYRSMGVMMPRNTSDQSVSPASRKRLFSEKDGADVRQAAIDALEVGDLVYIPGHVMMVIGRLHGEPWVIHDTTGISYRVPENGMVRVPLNAVSVTPLLPLQFNENERYIDRMTSIVRIAADAEKEAPEAL